MGLSSLRVYEIVRDAGFCPLAYSGRGMHGKQCIAFVPVHHDASPIGAVALCLGSVLDTAERHALVLLFQTARTDSLGRGTVIYFPTEAWDVASME